ncbi:MAG TPA: site-specific integrase, partial [Candidatus Micrarchaeaceae archaeon]|nr:site-specific integrase [Candidatus Micrarchaeaceae archaeon]
KNRRKPLGFSKTVVTRYLAPEPVLGHRPRAKPGAQPGRPSARLVGYAPEVDDGDLAPVVALRAPSHRPAGTQRMAGLVREWLAELKVMGRSEQTIKWYRQKMEWYLDHESGPGTLDGLTSAEVKRLLGTLIDRGLKPNTVHGSFEVVRAFANWALREGFAVDPAVVRMRPPKLPVTELETYTDAQQEAILAAAAAGWPRLAVQILLGTGMRVGELAELKVGDFEDDGSVGFLKIRKGKGAKFRRVPLSTRLRREIDRYLNRTRPETDDDRLLVTAGGEPVRMMTIEYLLRRIKLRVGFKVHAHKFRHTFATEYLRREGDIERLRRILGHSSYVMVMRYLHLDKGDLGKDFDLRSPF